MNAVEMVGVSAGNVAPEPEAGDKILAADEAGDGVEVPCDDVLLMGDVGGAGGAGLAGETGEAVDRALASVAVDKILAAGEVGKVGMMGEAGKTADWASVSVAGDEILAAGEVGDGV